MNCVQCLGLVSKRRALYGLCHACAMGVPSTPSVNWDWLTEGGKQLQREHEATRALTAPAEREVARS